METTLAWAADGRLKATVDDVLPLERGAEAFARMRQRQVTGKIVLTPADGR
jgi:NADPH:quinone reductase-like Zn-dependent oxidoreductase